MAANITTARPYAKAVFEHAKEKQAISVWAAALSDLRKIITETSVIAFLDNPSVLPEQKAKLLLDVVQRCNSQLPKVTFESFLNLLVKNRRLMLIPEISIQFDALRDQEEKVMVVNVVSFNAIGKEHETQLTDSLSKRLKRRIVLNVSIDKSLLGGAVIHAGDLVIDGSVREKLNQLANRIVA